MEYIPLDETTSNISQTDSNQRRSARTPKPQNHSNQRRSARTPKPKKKT